MQRDTNPDILSDRVAITVAVCVTIEPQCLGAYWTCILPGVKPLKGLFSSSTPFMIMAWVEFPHERVMNIEIYLMYSNLSISQIIGRL